MSVIFEHFFNKKWGAFSMLIGLALPGFIQIFINNYDFVLKEEPSKSIAFMFAISLPTYAFIVLGTCILIWGGKVIDFLILASSSNKGVWPYGLLAGVFNIFLVWPENVYKPYEDDFMKYFNNAIETQVDYIAGIIIGYVALKLFHCILKKIAERIFET